MKTFDNEVTLIGDISYSYDDVGNTIKEQERRTILCNELSVYGADFYRGASVGLKPELVLEIHDFEYQGEKQVIYKEKLYEVLRTYDTGDYIELTVGDKLGT